MELADDRPVHIRFARRSLDIPDTFHQVFVRMAVVGHQLPNHRDHFKRKCVVYTATVTQREKVVYEASQMRHQRHANANTIGRTTTFP